MKYLRPIIVIAIIITAWTALYFFDKVWPAVYYFDKVYGPSEWQEGVKNVPIYGRVPIMKHCIMIV
jgi:hypothetical protein